MRIESKGIVISQIFHGNADEGETIEISADGEIVTLTLGSGKDDSYTFGAAAFRELLAAMRTADQEITKIELRSNGEPA